MTELAQQLAAARKAWLEAAAREQHLLSNGPTVHWIEAQETTRAARKEYDRLLFSAETV